MLNKDKRSLILCLVLGDGCLHYYKRNNKKSSTKVTLYGGLTIAHAVDQADYISWKAQLVSKISNRSVKLRLIDRQKTKGGSPNNQNQFQFALCWKRLRAWRKFTYPNGKKDLTKILKYIRHPEMALAVWLMDDGYVEPSIKKSGYASSASLRLFACDQSTESLNGCVDWLKREFNIDAKIAYQKDSKKNKSYPFLKLLSADSLLVWERLREFILQFESMQHKFRHIEQVFQRRLLQRQLEEKSSNDIVSTSSNVG